MTMDKDFLIKLTLFIYQTSEHWPEDNLLKFKIRNLANEILADCILLSQGNFTKTLQSKLLGEVCEIQECFVRARAKRFLNRNEFLLFQKEYNNIKRKLGALTSKGIKQVERRGAFLETEKGFKEEELREREKKILEILEEKGKAQVQDLQKFFPNISKRTLRRDLENLLKKGLVQRSGEWSRIFYYRTKIGQE